MQNDKAKFKEKFVARLVDFLVDIIKFSDLLRIRRTFWSISDQLVRSSTSIGANVVEAKASSSKRDYTHFFEIALKSANETIYWLLVLDRILGEKEKLARVGKLIDEVEEIAKILGSSVLTLKGKR